MLIGNYSLLNKSFARPIGGQVASGNRSSWNNTGGMRNWGKQTGLNWKLAAVPQGHSAGGAWMLPRTAGGMTSRNAARLGVGGTANGAEGYGIDGTASLSLTALGIGGLIAGGVGTASITLSGGGSVTATISSTGTAIFTLSGAANIGAKGWISGEAPISVSGTMIPYAKGHMTGTTADLGLTVAGITNAVWTSPLATYQGDGTAGKALSAASSGGVDYQALGAAVWSSVSRTLTSGAGTAPTTAEISAAIQATLAPSFAAIPAATWAETL